MGTEALVAEIRSLYGRRHEEKVQIQQDMAALRDQYGWTQQMISDETGVPRSTVDMWLRAYDEGLADPSRASRLTPASAHARSDRAVAKRVFATAPMEDIEHVISSLPPERVQQVAAAAGNAYHQARVEYAENERNLTPRERSEREAAGEALTEPVRKAAAGFTTLGIVGHLEQATDELHELTSDGSLTPKLVRQILRAKDAFESELSVAAALVGLEEES